jgi:hypothetical protein
MDEAHTGGNGADSGDGARIGGANGSGAGPDDAEADSGPRDDDERFIVGLVLTYYRRHPRRARARLLDLLGEVLLPDTAGTPGAAPSPAPANKLAPTPAPGRDEDGDLWRRTRSGVAPLKRPR